MNPLSLLHAGLAAIALMGLGLVGGCTAADDAPGEVQLDDLGAYASTSGTGLISSDPPPPAPSSAIDPVDPWASLGPMTGRYRLHVERLDHDCSFGPDVPLSSHYRGSAGSPITTTWVTEESFGVDLVQRGDAIAFELGEGVVRATWSQSEGRLEHVERAGAEGATRYVDGFDVQLGATGFVIEGESDWLFADTFYAPGESCSGRTRWRAEQAMPRPRSLWNDFQVVLRWPSSSDADLDLMVRPPYASEDARADLVRVEKGCHVLRSTGRSAAALSVPWSDLIADSSETALPYHEEVIRCSAAAWGEWRFDVMNWSGSEGVEFEIEAFWGPRVNTRTDGERSFGAIARSVAPLALDTSYFELRPPPSPGPGSSAGAIIGIVDGRIRLLAEREPGPWTDTLLEFRKAALEGLSVDDFVDEISRRP